MRFVKTRNSKRAAPGSGGSEAISDPHNSFFAFAFGEKVHAAGLLRAVLPPDLVRRLDWRSLARRQASFVDAKLRWLHSDLLFSVRALDTREEVFVYTLIEHQSSPHALMAYRMLRYVVRICDEHLKTAPDRRKLPLVIPLVIYNGAEPWNAARTLRELFGAPTPLVETVAAHLPQCGYLLVDLRHRDADLVVGEMLTAFGKVALRAMELSGDDDAVLDGVQRMKDALTEMMAQRDGRAALGALLRYLLATHERIDRSKLERTIVDAVAPAAGENIVTVYDQLIQEGKQKLLLDQLTAKFGTLPAKALARIEKADSAKLSAWGLRLLTASTLDEVLGSSAARAAGPDDRSGAAAEKGGATARRRASTAARSRATAGDRSRASKRSR
jgi:hypothetical protein